MSISFLGAASAPTDNGTNTTDPTAITPVANMQQGDLVVLQCVARVAQLATIAMSNTGGQTWSTAGTDSAAGVNVTNKIFYCTFNGTWSANPSVSFGSGLCNTVYMQVYRPTTQYYTWAIDVAATLTSFSAQLTPTQGALTALAVSTVAIYTWAVAAANTWSSLTAGYSYAGSNQVRNTSGSGSSISVGYKILTTTNTSTGTAANTQSSSVAGIESRLVFKEVSPITLFGSASNPADNSTNTADPTAVTPPASMLSGDLVVMVATARAASLTMTISQASGQSWQPNTQRSTTNLSVRMFWCIFNGTWGSDPSVSFGSSTCNSVVMHVFRPAAQIDAWAIDIAEAFATFASQASPSITGVTPTKLDSLTLALWAVPTAGTWSALSAGWSVAGSAQYRNTSGSGLTSRYAYMAQTTLATGNVVSTQSPNSAGGDIIVTFFMFLPSGYDEFRLGLVRRAIVNMGLPSVRRGRGPYASDLPTPHLGDEPRLTLRPRPAIAPRRRVPPPTLEVLGPRLDDAQARLPRRPQDVTPRRRPAFAEWSPVYPSPHVLDEILPLLPRRVFEQLDLRALYWAFDKSGDFAPGGIYPFWYPFSQDRVAGLDFPFWYAGWPKIDYVP